MTFFIKILQKLFLATFLLFFIFSETELYAQISSEQINQLNQYTTLINDYKKQGKFREVGYYLYKSGSVYLKAGEHANAIDKFKESADYYEQIGSFSNKKKIYGNIAFVYAEMGQLKNSKKYYSKSLQISRRLNNRHDISANLMEVATIEIYSKDYATAQTNLEEALKIGNELNDALLLRTCYRLLAQLYKAYGNKKKSDQYFDNFLIYDKHVKEEGTIKRENIADKAITSVKEEKKILMDEKEAQALFFEIADLRNKLQKDSLNRAISASADSLSKIEKLTALIKREKELVEQENDYVKTKDKNQQLKIESQNLYIYGGVIGIILLLMVIIGAIIAFLQKRKANKQLEQQKIEIEIKSDQVKNKNDELEDAMGQIQYQNKNIMQSINYAQRIQEAMMPEQVVMQTLFAESFILFKPRDVVSGDFYWFSDTKPEINGTPDPTEKMQSTKVIEQNRKFIVSAIDCTGHGVPGAFMSMLGNNLLNDIVAKGTIEPDKILSKLHKGIRSSLNQDATQNRDGMDMALCVIDPEAKTMEYSGAQNPLIYIQDGKLFRVRGSKFPVGGFQVEQHHYDKHIIKIDRPTTCFIFTDGFHDQFGGPQGRKFMTKNFRELLYEIYKMPMEEQKNILELVINEWMGDNEQTDDILIIGFRLDFSDKEESNAPTESIPEKGMIAKEELEVKEELPVKKKLLGKNKKRVYTEPIEVKKEKEITTEELKTKNELLENDSKDKNKLDIKDNKKEEKTVKKDLSTVKTVVQKEKIIKKEIVTEELKSEENEPKDKNVPIKEQKTEKDKKDIKIEKKNNIDNKLPINETKIIKTELQKEELKTEKTYTEPIEVKKQEEKELPIKEEPETDKKTITKKGESIGGNFNIRKLKTQNRKDLKENYTDHNLNKKDYTKPVEVKKTLKKSSENVEIENDNKIVIRKL